MRSCSQVAWPVWTPSRFKPVEVYPRVGLETAADDVLVAGGVDVDVDVGVDVAVSDAKPVNFGFGTY